MGRIAVVGASGFVGSALVRRLGRDCVVTPVGRPGDRLPPGVFAIVNAAALSTIAGCEADPRAARIANADLPARLAELARDGTRLIQLSTDQVFDGQRGRYRETDPPNPISEYGRTKLAGEEAVLRGAPNAVVLRLNLVCGRSRGRHPSSVDRMLGAARQGRKIPLFTDEYRSPVAITDVVEATTDLLHGEFRGILHLGGPRLSRHELGLAILDKHGLSRLAAPVCLSDYSGPPRTPDTSFDTSLAQGLLERAPRPLSGILEDC